MREGYYWIQHNGRVTGFVSLKSAYICAFIEKFTKEIIRNER